MKKKYIQYKNRTSTFFKTKISFSLKKMLWLSCCTSYFLGIWIGGMNIALFSNGKGYFQLFIEKYLSIHFSRSIFDIWQTDFLSNLFLMVLLLFSALSCVGTPIAVIVPGIRGVFTGLLSAVLYQQQGKAGIILNSITFWIPNVCIAGIIIFFAVTSAESSIKIFQNISSDKNPIKKFQIKELCWKFFVLNGFGLFICFIQAVLIVLFAPLFRL